MLTNRKQARTQLVGFCLLLVTGQSPNAMHTLQVSSQRKAATSGRGRRETNPYCDRCEAEGLEENIADGATAVRIEVVCDG